MIEVDPRLIKVLQPDTWAEVTYLIEDPETGEMDTETDEGYVAELEDRMLYLGDETLLDGWIVRQINMKVDI